MTRNWKGTAALAVALFVIGCSGGSSENATEDHAASGEAATNEAPAAAEEQKEAAAAAGGKVTTTASGLQYEVLKEGSGEHPTASDTVTVHYRGTLEDGTEFDSSHKRGQPATFPLNRVIPGWTEGVQLMQPGAQYKFTIPSELGYGKRGVPGSIPADATLIFEVELISIQ